MTARTLQIAATEGCLASINWNDATNTATGVTVDNMAGSVPIAFAIVTGGFSRAATVQPGSSSQIIFPSALSVTLGAPKANSFVLIGLISFSIGGG